MHIVLTALGAIFYLTPIAYTFLRAFGKVGPEDQEATFWVAVLLWIAGLACGGVLLYLAATVWPGLMN